MKMKSNKIYISLCVIFAIFLCGLFISHLFNDDDGALDKKSIKSGLAAEIMFSNNLLYPNMAGYPDPFIGSDFLDKKIMQLVATAHLATQHALKNNSLDMNGTDFSYILDELMTCIKTKNFFSQLGGCKETDSIQVQEKLYETKNFMVYSGMLNNAKLRLEMAKADVDLLISAKCGSSDSDRSQLNLDRCFLLKNRKIFDEAVLLIQLSHPNIAKMLGLCIRRIKSGENKGKITSSGVVLSKETGVSARIEELKMFDWEDRLKVCIELLKLVIYFADTPLGSVRLENWSPVNFIYNSDSMMVKLTNMDQLVYVTEPTCDSDRDCFVDDVNCGVKCESNRCQGFNTKRNLFDLNHSFISPLLRFNIPRKLSEKVLDILMELGNLKSTAADVLMELKSLIPDTQRGKPSQNELRHEVDNPAVLSMRKLADGLQVDSWEQHESKVSINEVNVEAEQAHPEISPSANIEVEDSQAKVEPRPAESQDKDGFQKIENADFPGRYDYRCPKSKAEWGCVMSLRTAEDATQKCMEDDKCKAIVTIPHLRKEGWIIAIFKSDSSKPVDHAGTTVYVRLGGGRKVTKTIPPVGAAEIKEKGVCLSDVINSQEKTRSANEARLMKVCGWDGRTDEDWRIFLEESKVLDAKTFKPARGKLANGGQMSVTLDNDSSTHQGFFLAKQGPEEYGVSQLAVYQLDRMLGLYKTIPVVERLLGPTELTDAGFPVDIGGNQFDKFRPLKQSDGSLLGVLVPRITEHITVQHYMSVPRLSDITNAVTPFNRRQWNDLEYLLLGFLTSIPVPSKGHQSLQGMLLHLKTDEAFLHSNNDYISYLYNCQFPEHVIDTLRHSETNHCALGEEIRTRLIDASSPSIAEVLGHNIAQLLALVDQCTARFGKHVVLYDSSIQSVVR